MSNFDTTQKQTDISSNSQHYTQGYPQILWIKHKCFNQRIEDKNRASKGLKQEFEFIN